MSGATDNIPSSIKQKVQTLANAYERLRQEHEQLQLRYSELQQRLSDKEQAVEAISGRYDALNLAQALKGSSADMHDAKIKVNRIVREIDKCIALLNMKAALDQE